MESDKESRKKAWQKEQAEREAARKEAKAQEKALARQERNAAQATEEKRAWAEAYEKAEKTMDIYKAKRGRPTVMTEAVQSEILERLTSGQSLSYICALEHMPSPTAVYDYLEKSPSFAENYTRACMGLATLLFNQCLDIADDDSNDLIKDDKTGEVTVNHGAIARAKLKIDTRFRMAGKLSGKYADKPIFGENAQVTVNSLTVNARDMPADDREKLRALLLQAKERATGQVIDG